MNPQSPNQHNNRQVYHNEIRITAGELAPSSTTGGQICPVCRGGATAERSFSITRTSHSTLLYICHRASCNFSGAIFSDNGGGIAPSTPSRQFTPQFYTGELRGLDIDELSILLSRYNVSKNQTDREYWSVDAYSGHLVVPIWSPRGILRGHEVRRNILSETDLGPKTRAYWCRDEPRMGWPLSGRTALYYDKAVVVVEDFVSALRVSRFYQTVYLLGTDLSPAKMAEISEVAGNRQIILAFDKDATGKAIEYMKEYRLMTRNLTCRPLSKDLKYESDNNIPLIITSALNYAKSKPTSDDGTKDTTSPPVKSPDLGEDREYA